MSRPASCILCCVIWRVVVTYSSGVSGGIPAHRASRHCVSQLAVSYIVWFDVSLSHIAVVYLGGFLLIGRAATGVSQLAVSYIVWFDVSLSHIAVVYLGGIPAHRASRHWCLPASCIICCVIWRVVVTYSSGVSGGFLLIGRAATSVSQLAVSYVVWFDVSLSHIAVVYLGGIPAHRASRHWCLPASCILYCVIWRVVVTYSSGVSGGDSCS